MSEFERFVFKPWMGYAGGLLLFVGATRRGSDFAMLLRGLGLTLFFGTSVWAGHSYRRRTREGASAGDVRSVVFAVLAGLLTLFALVQAVLDLFGRG